MNDSERRKSTCFFNEQEMRAAKRKAKRRADEVMEGRIALRQDELLRFREVPAKGYRPASWYSDYPLIQRELWRMRDRGETPLDYFDRPDVENAARTVGQSGEESNSASSQQNSGERDSSEESASGTENGRNGEGDTDGDHDEADDNDDAAAEQESPLRPVGGNIPGCGVGVNGSIFGGIQVGGPVNWTRRTLPVNAVPSVASGSNSPPEWYLQYQPQAHVDHFNPQHRNQNVAGSTHSAYYAVLGWFPAMLGWYPAMLGWFPAKNEPR
jgi:hypothetical protein